MPVEKINDVEVEKTSVSVLEDSESEVINVFISKVVDLVRAEEAHNMAGLNVIDLFDSTRLRLREAGYPAKEVPLLVYDSSLIVLANMEDVPEKATKRAIKELKTVYNYFADGLSIRHRAITFSLFSKVVALHKEVPEYMSKSKIKSALNIFKKLPADPTGAQVEEANKKYSERLKNLCTKTEAFKLSAEFDETKVPDGFMAIINQAKSMDKGAINNMIAGLKVAMNASEGIYAS